MIIKFYILACFDFISVVYKIQFQIRLYHFCISTIVLVFCVFDFFIKVLFLLTTKYFLYLNILFSMSAKPISATLVLLLYYLIWRLSLCYFKSYLFYFILCI